MCRLSNYVYHAEHFRCQTYGPRARRGGAA
jgi:hypothetical protein